MIGSIHTDGEDKPHVRRPAHKTKPSITLLQHSEQAALLPSQHKAVSDFHAEVAKHAAEHEIAVATCTIPDTPGPSHYSSPEPPSATASQVSGMEK